MLEPGHTLHRDVSWTANDTRRTPGPFAYRCLLKQWVFPIAAGRCTALSQKSSSRRVARGQGVSHTPQDTSVYGAVWPKITHFLCDDGLSGCSHNIPFVRCISFCSPLVLVQMCSLQKGFASEMVSQHLRSLWKLLVDVISNHSQEVLTTRSCSPCFFLLRAHCRK